MGAWIRGGVLTMLTFGAFWGGAILTWRGTGSAPSTADLLTYLVVLPLAVLAGVVLVRRLAMAQPAPASAPAATAAASAAPAAATAPRLPALALALLAAAVRTRAGSAVGELASAIAAQRARPDLDPELVDDAGYPVMSVRVPSAGDGAWRAQADNWLAAQGHTDARFAAAHWRALELASDVAHELADQAAPAAGADDDADAAPLRIVPLMPGHWTPSQRAAAGAWLAHVAVRAGWPDDRVTVSPAPPGEPSAAAVSLLSLLAGQSGTDAAAALTILLAFDSRIDQATVDRMAAEGTLFTATHAQGLIPGEGAAGLLLAAPAHARRLDPGAPTLQVAAASRASSADASGRVDAADLRRLAGRVLADSGVEAATVSTLVADADHRSSRVLEVMTLAHEDLPHLDAGIDVKATGPACGLSGAVPFLAALALAGHDVDEGASAVLCVGNVDPVQRSVALVRAAGSADA